MDVALWCYKWMGGWMAISGQRRFKSPIMVLNLHGAKQIFKRGKGLTMYLYP